MPLEPKIIESPTFTMVGCRATFISAMSPDANNVAVLGALWRSFGPRSKEVQNQIGHAMVGVVFPRPKAERKHPHELEYMAGVRVDPVPELPAGMTAFTVPAATYAAFTHRGAIERLGETIEAAHADWLPASAWKAAPLCDLEFYDDRFCTPGIEPEMEYWIAVLPRG